MDMPWDNIDIRVTHRNKGLLEILFTHNTGRTQQSTVRSALKTELDLI
jgi:hypothetical protein